MPKRPAPRDRCTVAECGRPSRAQGLCQTHHRQLLTAGKLEPIRPYRERRPGTVKLGGLRLTVPCAETVKAYAEQHGLSLGAAIADILEGWNARRHKPSGER
jgi:hypothetical protein